jgi:hypothetical protein
MSSRTAPVPPHSFEGSGTSITPGQQSQPASLGSVDSSAPTLIDFTPEWDVPAGGAKMLITCSGLQADTSYVVLFDQMLAVADMLTPMTLRCRVPPHPPGTVTLRVLRVDAAVQVCCFPYLFASLSACDLFLIWLVLCLVYG